MRNRAASRSVAVALTSALLLAAGPLFAQSWPTRLVRVIVPFGTGGGTDIQARLLANNLQKLTGQRFITENRPGAGGLIGAEIVINLPADGHTVLFTTATLAINTTLYSKSLKFDPQVVRERLEAKSYLHRGLKVVFRDLFEQLDKVNW